MKSITKTRLKKQIAGTKESTHTQTICSTQTPEITSPNIPVKQNQRKEVGVSTHAHHTTIQINPEDHQLRYLRAKPRRKRRSSRRSLTNLARIPKRL